MSTAEQRTVVAAGRCDRGSVAIEAAILIPSVLFFLLLVIAAGRAETAGGTIDAAARAGARSASLARTAGAARTAAADSVAASLVEEGVKCVNETPPVVDIHDFAPGSGTRGTVVVTVSCNVPLHDLSVPGLPGSITMTSSFTSVVDAYRYQGR